MVNNTSETITRTYTTPSTLWTQQHLDNISKQTTFNTQLPKEKTKLDNVIGDECNLCCKLNNYKLLLDTGADASLLSKDRLQKNVE